MIEGSPLQFFPIDVAIINQEELIAESMIDPMTPDVESTGLSSGMMLGFCAVMGLTAVEGLCKDYRKVLKMDEDYYASL